MFLSQGYVYPDVAFAISAVETGQWSLSTRIMRNNNLFAFKVNSRKRHVGISQSGYCIYINQAASLADYGAYELQSIRQFGLNSKGAYLRHIYRTYSADRHYADKIQNALTYLAKLT